MGFIVTWQQYDEDGDPYNHPVYLVEQPNHDNPAWRHNEPTRIFWTDGKEAAFEYANRYRAKKAVDAILKRDGISIRNIRIIRIKA